MYAPRVLVLLLVPIVIACLSACGGPATGSQCSSEGDCGSRLRCVTTPSGGICMAACDADTWLCQDGAVCLETPSDGRVCWFGGGTPLGESCTDDLVCEPGTACDPSSLCAQACDLEPPAYLENPRGFDPSSVCERTERCESLAGGVEGTCVTIPDAGGADAGVTSP